MNRDIRERRESRGPSTTSNEDDVLRTVPVRVADRLLAVAFVGVIWMPLAGMVLGLDSRFALKENRAQAPRPELGLSIDVVEAFPRKFEAYFNDHFGFRKRLISWLSTAKVQVLGVSSSPDVLLGKDGWLFFAGLNLLNYYRGLDPFTEPELDHWQANLEERRDRLARMGARYVVAIAPEKTSIYPEFIPSSINVVQQNSRADQLVDRLRKKSTVEIIDLREPMLRAKQTERLYHRTDTHWNDRGGHVAYCAMIEALAQHFPGLTPVPRSVFKPLTIHEQGGDLAVMLGLSERLYEDNLKLEPLVPRRARPVSMDGTVTKASYRHPLAVMECSDDSLPRAVMFRDSFTVALVPFLSEHFRRIAYAWTPALDYALVSQERPDIVIHEFVERELMNPFPKDLQPDPGEEFKQSTKVVFSVNSKTGFEGFVANTGTLVINARDSLKLNAGGPDPIVLVPPFSMPEAGCILKIDVTSPQDTLLQIFYLTTETTAYSNEHSVSRPIKKGRNEIVLALPASSLAGRLRLDPGTVDGLYTIHSIEVRERLW